MICTIMIVSAVYTFLHLLIFNMIIWYMYYRFFKNTFFNIVVNRWRIPIPTVFKRDRQYFGLEIWDINLFVSLARPFTICFLHEWNWSIEISQGYLHEENMRVNIKGPRQGNSRRNRYMYTRPSCIGPRKQNVWWTKLPGLHVNRGGFMSDIRPTPTVKHTKYSIWNI